MENKNQTFPVHLGKIWGKKPITWVAMGKKFKYTTGKFSPSAKSKYDLQKKTQCSQMLQSEFPTVLLKTFGNPYPPQQ
jgi:hypothetical protein